MKPSVFVQQQGESDCGVACLLSVIRYHGGDASLERLRELSGTSIQGTSLLGLQQAANILGLEAEAFEVEDLEVFRQEATFPCILHVVIDEKLEHYVIAHKPPEGDIFNIFDPANGFETWNEEKLHLVWKSGAVLMLNPSENFERVPQGNKKKIEWFKNIIREDTPMLIIAAVLGIVLAALGMATAIFSQKLLDEILPKHQTQRLWLGMGLLAVLLLARAGISYLRGFFLLRQSRDFNSRMMDDFYDKLLHLPKTFFDTRKTGEIITRLNDTRRIQAVISYLTGNVVIDVLVLLVSAVFIFSYSITIGCVALLSVPLFGFLIWRYNDRIIKHQKAVMSQYASTESHFVDAITGISTIKANNKESLFSTVGRAYYQVFQQKSYELGTLGNRYGLWNEVLNASLIIMILSLSAYSILQKEIKIGEMMAIISIASGMIGSVGRLATTNIQLQEAKVAFERMYEFASVSPEKILENIGTNQEIATINSINIHHLSFHFAGKSQLLKDVSLTINKGEITALLGEVGSGKSILLQILQKFQPYESGEILINGNILLKNIASNTWRSKIGVVPQEIKVFNGTLIDNIVLGNIIEGGEKAISLCETLGFSQFFETLPQGYLTIVGEEGINLSGGQKQLLALARALYHKPNLLLLDEATSAMDSKTEQFVLGLLEKLKPNLAILMITHNKTIAEIADGIYELENGMTYQTQTV
ncbi:peptidase domain-containing ABC transporter [Emticicia oligotrophica]|uniref:peptidase domain-containing ABC transporter n=1 Tax=Emticicia oligotrophica TaxID=312279 RepID=UPI00273B9AA6|nr:peptidase domain-containing ABC transporter [Emticicia oligotrophica]